jgi:uncharacterized protein YaaW (UPF0174 family)
MSLEDIVEEYSKKWNVSKEEAEKRIKKLLEKFPPSDKTPSPNNIFPEPIGEISRKIQDINQALLTTAYTTRLLKTPPDEIMELKERIERIDSIIADIKSGLETKINELTKILDEKTKKEQREELLNELNSRIDPIRQNLEVLMKKLEMLEKGGKEESSITSQSSSQPESILEEAEKVAENAKRWLERIGYRVEPEKLTKSEVQKMIEEAQKKALENLPIEEIKKKLEQAGYKIIGGPLTWDQVEKLIEEAKKRAQEEVLEDKRIDAVADIIRDSVSRIIEMFKPAVELWFTQGGSEPRSTLSTQQS